MAEIIGVRELVPQVPNVVAETTMIEAAEVMLEKTSCDILKSTAISVPIAQLATLGAGVSSLIPALRTVTQTTTLNGEGLYRWVNQAAGDVLKSAKNGYKWGASKSASGASKMVQLQEVGEMTATSTAIMPVDPATLLIAVALFTIEQKMDEIAETSRQVLCFLEVEKEAEVEADAETLTSILADYKHNWDNERAVITDLQSVKNIRRTARDHMISYQKTINGLLDSKRGIVLQTKVSAALEELLKRFRYYRLSLYTFSMASFLEVVLTENYKEDNISRIEAEIEQMSMSYRDAYAKCSVYLERLSDSAVEANLLKGVSAVSKTAGKIIGSIPVIQKGPVDEFLQSSGERLGDDVLAVERRIVAAFAEISNPGTGVFVEKLEDMIQIYGRTTDICFDEKNIYLIAG